MPAFSRRIVDVGPLGKGSPISLFVDCDSHKPTVPLVLGLLPLQSPKRTDKDDIARNWPKPPIGGKHVIGAEGYRNEGLGLCRAEGSGSGPGPVYSLVILRFHP